MEGTESMIPYELEFVENPAKGIILSVLLAIIIAGALPLLSYFFRPLTWMVWVSIIWITYRFSKELPLWRLIRPAALYLLWLFFYLVWALIVSPNTDIVFAVKVALTTLTLGCCMAIFTAKPHYLRIWANAVQFAIIGNLLVLVLMTRSAEFAALVQARSIGSNVYEFGISRFGGLWGNANNAGFVCLVATILSVLATPWIAWLGRLSCLPLLYLGVSRKSVILYLLIILYYLIAVRGRNVKFWIVTVTIMFSTAVAFELSEGLRTQTQSARGNATVSRLMDLRETEISQSGRQTRLDLLHQWMTAVQAEPWYGYGLKAMGGTVYDEKDPEKVAVKGLFPMGTHNTYLGVLIEIGPLGFVAFILMLIHYMRNCLFTGGDPITRWVLVSFMVVNLATLLVSHDHLFNVEGVAAFTLFLLLPTCAGLPKLCQSLN